MRNYGAQIHSGAFAAATPTANTNSPLYVGARGTGGTTNLIGLIGEIIVIKDGTTSLDELEKLEGYLAWKWGFVGQLDSAHPYKERAP